MIVFLANESPWPAVNGGRSRMAGLVAALRRRYDVEVVVARRGAAEAEGALALPAARRSRVGALAGAGPRLGRGLLDRPAQDALARACAEADAVVVSHSYLAAELPPLDAPVVVDLQNLETERQASAGGWLGALEAAKARRWEPAVVASAAAVVCVDEADAQVARAWGGRRVVVVPNVAPVPACGPSPDAGPVLALADWTYGPNAEGLALLVEQVQPLLAAELVLAGRGSEAHGGLGFVPDPTPLYERSAVVVSPVRRGAGTQLKVVEALTRGRVVVTTGYGARSVPAGAQDGCVVADGAPALAAALDRLVADPAERHRRERALAAAALPRDWAAAAAPLLTALAEVLGG
ncbi:MAG: glycosyltransferase family 4 protein [Mycobacteriales bacterium]